MLLMPHLCHTVSYWTIMNLQESNTKVKNCFRDTEPRKPGGQLQISIEYSFFLCVSKPRIFAQKLLTRSCPTLPGPHCPCFKFEPKPAFLDTDLIQFIFCSHITVLQILHQPSWLFSFHTKLSVCFCCWSACADLTISCFWYYMIGLQGLNFNFSASVEKRVKFYKYVAVGCL